MDTIPERLPMTLQTYSVNPRLGKLADHRPYDLKITLDERHFPAFCPFYSLSQEDLQLCVSFIDENHATGFIRPSRSSHGAPVLFIRKKDGSFNFALTSKASTESPRKTGTPLLLISDLFRGTKKSMNLHQNRPRHAYHLVWVAPGEEWKTAFRTHYGSFK